MKFRTNSFTPYQILDMHKHNELNIIPKLTSNDDWNETEQRNYVYSAVEKTPLTPIYLVDCKNIIYILDGKNRIDSILNYFVFDTTPRSRFNSPDIPVYLIEVNELDLDSLQTLRDNINFQKGKS